MSSLINIDDNYKKRINEVSLRYKQSQIKAAIKVNTEMLKFYRSLGKDISSMSKNAQYGNSFFRSVSDDLEEIFPDVKSFSVTNLKYTKYFYEPYPISENRQQLVDDLTAVKFKGSLPTIEEIEAELSQ
ncbi:MAG: hypothetical protein IJR45_06745 [Firmicutes bacterium]|nr:hypothetical protein [Bacillota bacterium]MBQ9605094.1 hypothetical protein [Bacillota bacterium]